MKGNFIKFTSLILLFLLGIFLSLFYGGSQSLSNSDVLANHFIFWQIRIPKAITAVLAGTTLSCAGLILQIIFRNPLAGPYVLGISSGASLMVAIAILGGSASGIFASFFLGRSLLIIASICGSLAVTFFILLLSKKIRSNVILLLIGLMTSQICGALQGAFEYFANPNELKGFVIWGMGSLSNTTLNDTMLFIPIALLFTCSLIFFIKPLNAFLLGENYAVNAGINYHTNRFYLILISSVLTGVTTAFCGPIAFVGIAVPLLARMVFQSSSQSIQLPACILLGSIILLFSDVACFTLSKPAALPINMITTFIGAPLVIYMLFKNKQW